LCIEKVRVVPQSLKAATDQCGYIRIIIDPSSEHAKQQGNASVNTPNSHQQEDQLEIISLDCNFSVACTYIELKVRGQECEDRLLAKRSDCEDASHISILIQGLLSRN
jgi:hypothetical protein